MADADPIHRIFHPVTAQQAGYPAWTADPAIPILFAALRDLNAVAARLEALHYDRPDLGADRVRGEVGEVASFLDRCPGRLFDYGWRTRANGGACAGLWELLGCRRKEWIDARLEVEGFPASTPSGARHVRADELDRKAATVEAAWERTPACSRPCSPERSGT
ncbi:MAG: hypothetical protein JWN66_3093 [Sphingomonas bacterium]|uniref:hypothetical protein n=1 Tax=Sphingomonas bacterium TaxID=1895847 RepID=UPI00263114BF|nr:hypothetical protein [Sphingomonas bacterium]MDB5705977.1 hypothetical protein [Sphingomonas bacterium]